MFIADRNSQDVVFHRLSSLDQQVMDLKFCNKGVMYHSENRVYFIKQDKLKEALDHEKKTAPVQPISPLTRRQKRDQKAASGVEQITENEVEIKSVQLSASQSHRLIDDGDAILSRLKPDQLLELANDEQITETDLFDDAIILYVCKVSKVRLLVAPLDSLQEGGPSVVKFSEVDLGKECAFGTVKPGANHNIKQPTSRFYLNNPFKYDVAYDLNISTRTANLVEEFAILGKKFDPSKYKISLIYAPTLDGVKVPISLVHPKNYLNSDNLPKSTFDSRKLLMKSYGCYGMSMNLDFEVSTWSLLERGWLVAFLHTRGGSELGKKWHLDASKLNKYKTVEDIIACAHFLIGEGFTHENLLCGTSNSAGAGMLASAMNLNPGLFKAVHLSAPFLDIKGSLIDSSLPLSKSDYFEFGDPVSDPRAYEAISSICPYTNLQAAEYPSVIITAFKEDYRTPLSNVFKYAAKFRDTVKQPSRVAEYCDKNISIIVDEGSHLGTADDQSNIERNAITTAYYEWVVDGISTDLDKKVGKKWFRNIL